MSRIIAPSILSADFLNLGKDIQMLNSSKAEWIHLDVMDGHFVPNISFGIPILKAIRKSTKKIIDVHLMISNPEKHIDIFIEEGADILTVHYEAVAHLHRTMEHIRQKGIKAGVSLNPRTSIDLLEDIIPHIDLVLIMSVNPGFGCQKFIDTSISKIKKLKELINNTNSNCLIEIDGGVSVDNAKLLYNVGADVLVAGNAVFNSNNPDLEIQKILTA